MGEVRIGDAWLSIGAASQVLKSEEKLARYRQVRDAAGDTATDHIRVVRWCAHEGLVSQEQLHLSKALEQQTTKQQTHEIKSRLGLVRYDDKLMPAAQAEVLKRQARDTAAAMQSWKVRLTRWRDDLESKSTIRQAAGEEKLQRRSRPGGSRPDGKAVFGNRAARRSGRGSSAGDH